MKKVKEPTIRDDIDLAYSINFMMLENISNLLPFGNQTVFNSEFIKREKTLDEIYEDELFYLYADFRNQVFSAIKEYFEKNDLTAKFKLLSKDFLNSFNATFNKNIKYGAVFSASDVLDWFKFNRMSSMTISKMSTAKNYNEIKLRTSFTNFLVFYDDYKNWIAEKEIFEKLNEDITDTGSKSVLFEKQTNPNLIMVEANDFFNFAGETSKICSSLKQQLEQLIKQSENLTESNASDALFLAATLGKIDTALENTSERFEYANTNVLQLGKQISRLAGKMAKGKNLFNFHVDKIYVHKNELISMFDNMKYFPEFEKQLALLGSMIFENATVEVKKDSIKFEIPAQEKIANI